MDTWRAVYRSSEENQKRTMVEKSMAYAFPVQVIRNVHRAKIRVPLTDPEYGIVADGGHCSLLGKGKKPVAPSDQEEADKQETHFFHQDSSFFTVTSGHPIRWKDSREGNPFPENQIFLISPFSAIVGHQNSQIKFSQDWGR